MERKKKRLVIANWKMNPASVEAALKLATGVKKSLGKINNVQTVICPPSIFISDVKSAVSGSKIGVGSQNVFTEKTGPYTGEVSASQLLSLGVSHVIVGHSERRAMGETNELIGKKVEATLKEGLVAILCVGESVRDEDGNFLNFVKQQLEVSLSSVPRRYFLNLVIAYEPVWAISSHATGTETPADMLQMSIFIRKTLGGICGKDLAVKVPIIYGGSVDELDAGSYLSQGGADGVLVGKASLSADSFVKIINSVNEAKIG